MERRSAAGTVTGWRVGVAAADGGAHPPAARIREVQRRLDPLAEAHRTGQHALERDAAGRGGEQQVDRAQHGHEAEPEVQRRGVVEHHDRHDAERDECDEPAANCHIVGPSIAGSFGAGVAESLARFS
jgi:hypothetical protein